MIPGRPIVRHTQRVRYVVLNACRITWFKVSDSQRLAGWGLQATPGGNIRRKSVRPVRPAVRPSAVPSVAPPWTRPGSDVLDGQSTPARQRPSPSLPPSFPLDQEGPQLRAAVRPHPPTPSHSISIAVPAVIQEGEKGGNNHSGFVLA